MVPKNTSQKIVGRNKKAFHEYHIEETFEAGMILSGAEVKSLRSGKVNLRDGYGQIKNGEVFLCNVHISPYSYATLINQDPLRMRKLLLHHREIGKLIGKVQEKGIALIPIKIYFIENGKAKVELALGRGKKLYDKRASLKEKESQRDIERTMRTMRRED